MARRFASGLVTGVMLGAGAAVVASVVAPPSVGDATAASKPSVEIERTTGPRPTGLPRLRSDSTPAGSAVQQGDE